MKVLYLLSSVLPAAVISQNVLNIPGIDAWQAALQAHAVAEGRLNGVPTNTSPLPGTTNIQGLPQWQMHQANVLAAERALESQVKSTAAPIGDGLRVFGTAPTFARNTVEGSSSPSSGADNDFRDSVKSSLTKFIGQVQKDRKEGKTVDIGNIGAILKGENIETTASPDYSALLSQENLETRGSETFLDRLLNSFTADSKPKPKPTPKPKAKDGIYLSQIIKLATTTEKIVKTTTEKPKTVLSELLGILDERSGKTTEKPRNALEEIIERLESESKQKTTEKPEEDSLSSLIELLTPKKSTKPTTTTTTEAPALSLAEILGVLDKAEDQPSNLQLVNEIDEFLDILQQIDPNLVSNEVESVRGGSRGNNIKSNFIEEELTSAAEESEILNRQLEELLEELEDEKQKDLEFLEETYRIINSRLQGNVNLQEITKDKEFVNSVFHRFAVLGIPLREEDLSIQALLQAKQTVTENVLAAAEESKRIAIEIKQDLQGKLRRQGRRLSRKDMLGVEKRLKKALRIVRRERRHTITI